MKFNFKSTGYKVDNKKIKMSIQQKESLKKPAGIKTPLSFGTKNIRLFEMNYNPIDQIKDNLRNLLQTNAGERLGRHNFGCNLSALVFERTSLDENFNEVAAKQIFDQIKKYMPIIQIDNIDFEVNKKSLNDTTSIAKIIANISFSIPRIQLANQMMQVIIYAGG